MENIERQLVRINNSMNNIYSTMNVLSNSLLIQQTNSLIESLRSSTNRLPARARPTSLFTTPTPPPTVNRRTQQSTTPSTTRTMPTPPTEPRPTPPTEPRPNRPNRRNESDAFNSFFNSLMSNDFANMEVSVLGLGANTNTEENIVISHHNIFNNTKVLIKKYENVEQDSNEDEDNDSLAKCTICQDYIRDNSIVRQINKCRHTFHIECADRWFQDNIKCPHCRQDIREEIN